MKEDIQILLWCFRDSDSWNQKDATRLLNIHYTTKVNDRSLCLAFPSVKWAV